MKGAPAVLRRILDKKPSARGDDRCELCSHPLPDDHQHLVDLDSRYLLCCCRPCWLLFTPRGAGKGKYQAVPERVARDETFALGEALWEELQIPVRLAFFFHNTSLGRVVAFYPSPAGATESLLPLGAWERLVAANPLLVSLEPDVEALLVRGGRDDDAFECFLVPIDACYELTGIVRRHWKGFDGGEEAWSEIDAFFARLRERGASGGSGAGS